MSRSSVMSATSSKVLEEVAAKSQSRYAVSNSEYSPLRASLTMRRSGLSGMLSVSTHSMSGLYISKNMRMGRGVTIPKLGVFTFTPPEIRLKVRAHYKAGRHQSRRQRPQTKKSHFRHFKRLRQRQRHQARSILSPGIRLWHQTLYSLWIQRRSTSHQNQPHRSVILCQHVQGQC